MKRALVATAIFAVVLVVEFVFDRRSTHSNPSAQTLPGEFWESLEDRRQAEEKVQNIAKNSSEPLAELVALMSDRDAHLRMNAIREIAKSGRADMIPVIKRALDDEDKEVRGMAIAGIEASFEADPFREARTSAPFKEELFALVAAHVRHDLEIGKNGFLEEVDFTRKTAIRLLLRMNKTKAAELLQHPDLLRVTHPDFDEILTALSDAGIPITLDLTGLLDEFRPKAETEDDDYHAQVLYGQLLRAAATQKHPRAEAMIQEALNFTDGWTIPERAAEARWILLGLSPTLDTDIMIQADKDGADKLDTPLRHYLMVSEYYYDGMNGGLSQYFLNPLSDEVRTNVVALKDMGADVDAWRIEQAMRLFGPDGPPTDHAERQKLMDANDNKLFDQIDSIEAPDSVTQKYETIVHAKLYLARHVEACKKLPRNYP